MRYINLHLTLTYCNLNQLECYSESANFHQWYVIFSHLVCWVTTLYLHLVYLVMATNLSVLFWIQKLIRIHHHHHHDAKRSSVAFCRCDLLPKRAIFCQLQSVGHWYSRLPADLTDPSDGSSTMSAFPIRRWSGTILGFAASPKDLICWNVLCESGNVTKQFESLLANDGRGCQETGPAIRIATQI